MSDGDYSRYQREEGEPEIGPVLERARNERGLSLEDVEQATKIRKRYIVGLEQEDYGQLPAEIYLRGFLKTYADFLGLDGEEMVQRLKQLRPSRREYREDNTTQPEGDLSEPAAVNSGGADRERGGRTRGTILTVVVLAVVVAIVIIGGVFFMGGGSLFGSSPDNGGDERENLSGGEEDSTTTKPTTAKQETEPETLRVSVSVVENDSWLVVRSDGEDAYTRLTRPGFQRTFKAEKSVTIETGNAGAVEIKVNGQGYGRLGDSGAVLTRRFTLKDAA